MSQEEEESPAEGSKDEPGEQVELKEETEAPVEDTSQPSPPEPKGDAAADGEKATDKENGGKSEAQKPNKKEGGPCLILLKTVLHNSLMHGWQTFFVKDQR